MVLTPKQREELHRSILEYFKNNKLTKSYECLKKELGISDMDLTIGDLLEKKWTSVIRLQKKVYELEKSIKELKENPIIFNPDKMKEGIPISPAKHHLKGHRGDITRVAFHPVYDILASSSEDGSVKIWNFHSGKLEKTLKGHTGSVNCVNFSAKGNHLASCSADLTIKLWDVNSLESIRTLNGHEHNVSYVNFFPNGDFILSASRDSTLKMWELATGFCVRNLHGHLDWVRMGISSWDGNLVASCSSDQSIIIWNLLSKDKDNQITHVLREHDNAIEAIAFATHEANITIMDSEYVNINKLTGVGLTGGGTGTTLPVTTAIEEEKKALEEMLTRKKRKVDQFLASGGRDKLIKIWDVENGRCVQTLKGHDNWVRGLSFEPNGKYLFSVSDDKTLRVWELISGRCAHTINLAHDHFISCIAFNNPFPMIATGSVDASIKLWDCK